MHSFVLLVSMLLCSATVFAKAAADRHVKKLGRASALVEKGNYEQALKLLNQIPAQSILNQDMRLYLLGQSAFMLGRFDVAADAFDTISDDKSSRFRSAATWRYADTLWRMQRYESAASLYQRLLSRRTRGGEEAIAKFRLAERRLQLGDTSKAAEAFASFRTNYPYHVLGKSARQHLWALGANRSATLSPETRVKRAENLTGHKDWDQAIVELTSLPGSLRPSLEVRRKFWMGKTLFKMRRQYKFASDTLLSIYSKAGPDAPEALFYGARALSRADFDAEAIDWYQRVVREYPGSSYAGEAQYLSGWLEFNLGNYEKAIPYLKEMRRRFPKDKFADEALWYWGMSHYLAGNTRDAAEVFSELARKPGKEVGGKGLYWWARSLEILGDSKKSTKLYTELNGLYPFSWYALLARSRLISAGVDISPFGTQPGDPNKVLPLQARFPREFQEELLFKKSRELVRAGLEVEASKVLRYGQRTFLKNNRKRRAAALSALMSAYRQAKNYNRPWMLAVVHGGRAALDVPPRGNARAWWQHAYPLAFDVLIEKYRGIGNSPKYYLNTIMRKESGFDPHTHSYADARGLVQMIPQTTKRVVRELGIPFKEESLFEPEYNLKAGSWYIGRLHHKFSQQIPIGAGSYNSGPRPVMRWLNKNGERPMDEFVELVSYKQARNYMRRTTETYARYLYLYEGEVYTQPLVVKRDYVDDSLTY